MDFFALLLVFPLIFWGFYLTHQRIDDLRDTFYKRLNETRDDITTLRTEHRELGERIARLEARIPPLVRN